MRKRGQDHEGDIYRHSRIKLVETQEFQSENYGASMGQNQVLSMWETGVKLGLSVLHEVAYQNSFPMVGGHAQP